jgi:N-acetylgalactosamine kinase
MADNKLHVPVYSEQQIHTVVRPTRFDEVKEKFFQMYGDKPSFYARAPGRVNLIGEHVDYSGYSVLPMAIERDTVVAVKVRPQSKELRIANVDPKFSKRTFSKEYKDIVIDPTRHEWTNYTMAAYKGMLENKISPIVQPVGFDAMVHGNVPIGSGLSSSAALVCSFALATMYANRITISKRDMAEICAASEQYTGVQAGGMDQSISFLGEKGRASRIDFNPIRATPVPLPDDATFFVANSLVEANKYVSADTNYNMRVVECRLGAVVLAKCLNINWRKVRRLIDVQTLGNFTLEQLVEFVKKHLHPEPYTKSEIASILGISVEEVYNDYIKPVGSEKFCLRQRPLHVYEESKLVRDFQAVCQRPKYDKQLEDLGHLMNQSHASCRENFNCSCPELDLLTDLCRKAGALGSRLTGAGWGGCTISLVPQHATETFFKRIREEYYAKYVPSALTNINDVLFATTPGQGAFIYEPLAK